MAADTKSAWLGAAWGKFRNYERGRPERLDRAALSGARSMYEYMMGESSPDKDSVEAFLGGLSDIQRVGAGLFASWVKMNAEKLMHSVAKASVDGAHTTDDVSVQLLR